MISKLIRKLRLEIRRKVKPVSLGTAEQRSTFVSLIVLVDGDCESLSQLIRSLHTACAAPAEVDLALIMRLDHPNAEKLREEIAASRLTARIHEWRDQISLQEAYLAALRSLRGTWVGHTSISAEFSPRHFPKLRAAIRLSKRSVGAFCVAIQLPELKHKRLDPESLKGRHVLKNSGWQFPFMDLQNVYISRQLLAASIDTLPGTESCTLTSAWTLRALSRYFSVAGNEILAIKGAFKVLRNDALADDFHPLGLAAEIQAPHNPFALVDELQEIAALVRELGNIPHWLQVRVAVGVSRCMAALATARIPVAIDRTQRLEGILGEILRSLSPSLWIARRLLPVPLHLRIAAVSHLAGYEYLDLPVEITYYDPVSELIRIQWIEARPRHVSVCRNDVPVQFAYSRSDERQHFGHVQHVERVGWLPASALGKLSLHVNGRQVPISVRGKTHRTVAAPHIEGLLPTAHKAQDRNIDVLILRRLAGSNWARKRFKGCWLFIDKDDKADDNAEHFYRHACSRRDLRNKCYFIVRKGSPDWSRLKREGFRLLPFGGLLHKLALMNAAWLFSSHAAPFVLHLLPSKEFGDLQTFKFGFLQHGVTKDDQSAWLNSRNIELLVTAGKPEFASMTSAPYKYTKREVVLSGFPRYDALLARKSTDPKTVVIMPTWRKSLVGKLLPGSSQRESNPDFAKSQFFAEWNRVLSSVHLKRLKERGFRVVFVPHPNIAPYVRSFDLPPEVEIGDGPDTSIQDYLADCALLLTDYSSIAFDVAYLRRPIVYFQFDADQFFDSHTYSKGYFDYHLHGFGPVLSTPDEVISALVEASSARFPLLDRFRERINEFFTHCDAENSRRLVEAVLERSRAHAGDLHQIDRDSSALRRSFELNTPQLTIVRTGTR